MRIIRFLDSKGREFLGTDFQSGSAERLDGTIFDSLQPTGQRVVVKKMLVPVKPVNIFCIGLNYGEHAKEIGMKLPSYPVVFMKPTTAIAHPDDPVVVPQCCIRGPELDYEGELAVIIGRTARDVTQQEALNYVLGYTIANDISARKWQKHAGGGQWVRGKGFDSFCPLGPAIITADEMTDPQSLDIQTVLNQQIMQQSNTADMIFSVAEIIQYLSQDTTLLPGTVILTGTPSGIGCTRNPPVFLDDGDEVTVNIDKIGQLTNRVRR